HVNKVETKVEIRFHLWNADWIPLGVKTRMAQAYATKLNRDGELSVVCDETRSQARNAEICFDKLTELIQSCWFAPKKRVKTKPTRSSKEKRLTTKKRDGDKKKMRGRAE
ncbi:MAG: alternative ribosome rescue aminoacyl-tRNA hydrolase ArfB, partial [Bdellovibrionota bacterium]